MSGNPDAAASMAAMLNPSRLEGMIKKSAAHNSVCASRNWSKEATLGQNPELRCEGLFAPVLVFDTGVQIQPMIIFLTKDLQGAKQKSVIFPIVAVRERDTNGSIVRDSVSFSGELPLSGRG